MCADSSFPFTVARFCLGQLACSAFHMVFYKALCHKHKEGERQQHKANAKNHRNSTGAWKDRGCKLFILNPFSATNNKKILMLSLSALHVYIPGGEVEQIELWVLFPGNSSFKPNALHLWRECSCSVMAIHLHHTFSVRDVLTSYWVRRLQTSCFSSKYSSARHMGSHMCSRFVTSSSSVSAGIDRYM